MASYVPILAVLLLCLSATTLAADNCKSYKIYNKYKSPECSQTGITSTIDSKDVSNFERTYPGEITWAATQKMNDSSGMFMKLYKYIGGQNSAKTTIPMTIPVPKRIEDLYDDLGKKLGEVITMSFYLAESNPPAPTNNEVKIITEKDKTFFVREFTTTGWGDWMTRGQWNTNEEKLKETLIAKGMKFNPNVVYKVGYSPPWYLVKTCELWLEPQ